MREYALVIRSRDQDGRTTLEKHYIPSSEEGFRRILRSMERDESVQILYSGEVRSQKDRKRIEAFVEQTKRLIAGKRLGVIS